VNGRRITLGRVATIAAVLLCLGPPLAVALQGAGVPMPWAAVVPVAVAALLLRRVPELPLAAARRHPVLALAWVAVLAAGAVQTSRASLYAQDPARAEYSVAPGNPWRVEHCCFTAYAEGARFASGRVANVYDRSLYVPAPQQPRHLGPLKVDPFHYPPTFLLLPAAVRLVAPSFFDARRVWFGLQALVLGGALLAVGFWVGGDRGRRVALLAPLAWAAPVTFISLQMGNFQITAVPLALLGVMLAWSRRDAAGGALLAFTAAGKVFPSMLVLHVVAALRWRTVAWIAGMGLAFTIATAAAFGIDPFVEFVRDEFPRLVSGASFPQTEIPGAMPVNMSVYGFTAKLRVLGVTWLDQAAGKHASQRYALLLASFVVWAGLRVRARVDGGQPGDRLRLAILWLAILNLASLGGPFVPVMYGTAGTLWILTLLAATAETPARFWNWIALFVVVTAAILMVPTPRPNEMPATSTLILSLALQVGVFAVNVWAAGNWVRATRTARLPAAVPVQAV
jgi:alpha-1,2-mannosyltransferase